LVQSYVRLGLPQAVTSDPALQSDVEGEGAQFLNPTPGQPQPVPDQIAGLLGGWNEAYALKLLQAAQAMPHTLNAELVGNEEAAAEHDFVDEIGQRTTAWVKNVAKRAEPYIENKDAGGSGEPLSEVSPLIESTMNRMLLARDVLSGSNAPTAETLAPTEVGPTEATLKGEVDSYGAEIESCKFEYGSSQSYGSSVPCANVPQPSDEQSLVAQKVANWTPEGGFHARLVVTTWAGTTYGEDVKVQLAHAITVVTGPPESTTNKSATVTGSVNPNSTSIIQCRFLYAPEGSTEVHGVPCVQQVGTATSPVTVTGVLKGLKAGVKYEYWLQALNSAGLNGEGAHRTVMAKPTGKPAVIATAATEVTAEGATVNGTINPRGWDVQPSGCNFLVSQRTAAPKSVPCGLTAPLTGTSVVAVSAHVTGLQGGVLYKFRLQVTTASATKASKRRSFTTPAGIGPPSPVVVTGPAEGVNPTSATVTATVNPEGFEVTKEHCFFVVSGTEEEKQVPCEIAQSLEGSSAQRVTAQAGELNPARATHFGSPRRTRTGRALAPTSNSTRSPRHSPRRKSWTAAVPSPAVASVKASLLRGTGAMLSSAIESDSQVRSGRSPPSVRPGLQGVKNWDSPAEDRARIRPLGRAPLCRPTGASRSWARQTPVTAAEKTGRPISTCVRAPIGSGRRS
jgi:hypothetical protein